METTKDKTIRQKVVELAEDIRAEVNRKIGSVADGAAAVKNTASGAIREMADTVSDAAHDIAGIARDAARDVADTVSDAARDIAGTAKNK